MPARPEISVAMETVAHLIDHSSETDSGSATGSLVLTGSPVLCGSPVLSGSKLCQNTANDRWVFYARQSLPKTECAMPLAVADESRSLSCVPELTIPKPRVGVGGVCP